MIKILKRYSIILLVLLILKFIGVFLYFNNISYDTFTSFRNKISPPIPPITIVKIDDKSFGKGSDAWPWNRKKYVQFIKNIQECHPTVIGLDVLFTNTMEKTGDNLLAKELSKHQNIVLSSRYANRKGILKEFLPIKAFRQTAYGFVNISLDKDGICRKNKTLYKYGPKIMYSFDIIVLAKHLNISKEALIKKYVPPTKRFNSFFVNYIPYENFYRVSFIDTLNKDFIKNNAFLFRNRIVLLGATSIELNDLFKVPDRVRYPGVAIHGSTIWQVLNQKWITPVSSWLNFLVTFVLICVSLIIFTKIGLIIGFIIVVLSAITIFSSTLFAFVKGDLLINPFPAIIAIIIGYLVCIISKYFKEMAEKKEIKNIFGRYVSKDLINEILENKETLNLGGEVKQTAILFSDIKSFTTMSENNSPETIVTLLNQYFSKMVEILFNNEGSLDKFIGDAVMATFGVPITINNASFKAVKTAMEMQEALLILNESFKAQELPEIEIRIGVNTGNVVAGNIGSEERMEYTVMGDTVNLASRLEGKNKDYGTGILISEFTYKEIKDYIECKYIDEVIVKGKSKAVKVYEPLKIITLPKDQ